MVYFNWRHDGCVSLTPMILFFRSIYGELRIQCGRRSARTALEKRANRRMVSPHDPMHCFDSFDFFYSVSLILNLLFAPFPSFHSVMEQVNGYDTKADIWSLGITALELAKGYAPYARYPPMKVLILTIQEDPPNLDTYDQLEMGEQSDDELEGGEQFSRAFSSFIESCLQKNPSRRPACDVLLSSKVLSPLNDEATHARRRALLQQEVCDVCPDVGSTNNNAQSQQQQPGNVPISILLGSAKDRQPGTSWVFPDGSQIFASSVTNAASSDEVMAQLEEFAALTGGEHYTREGGGLAESASGDTVKASSRGPYGFGMTQEEDEEEEDDGLDDFMDQFEQETGGENFQRSARH